MVTGAEAESACASLSAPIRAYAACADYPSFVGKVLAAKEDRTGFFFPMLAEDVEQQTADDIAQDRRVWVRFLVDYGDVRSGERHKAYRTEALLMVHQGACELCTET